MLFDTQPIDRGNCISTDVDKTDVVIKESEAEKYFKPVADDKELICGGEKWFLWLADAEPG
jgi:hypothetical protein